MKKFLIALVCLAFTNVLEAQYVTITTSEPDAKIFVDGQDLGTGSYRIRVPSNQCVKVKIEKPGFLRYDQTYCNKGGQRPPSKQYFEMKKDDAEEASVKTDKANVDFSVEINKKLKVDDAWKLAHQIVTDYFDAIEVADKETSYLRTAWSIQTFQQNTIRTRLIIKLGNSNPLTYKVKLVSEYSGQYGTSVKQDELFREWDRVLRKFENVITDFSNRLGNR